MERYVQQLLEDIVNATENVSWPYTEQEQDVLYWISEEDEDKNAPIRDLEEWTGIRKEQLPPAKQLTDDQLHLLLHALIALLDAHNWLFVLQTEVPERVQYETIRENFDQEAKVKLQHMGFFQMCRPGTPYGTCALGEYCQCQFFSDLFAGFTDEERTPEEERAAELEIELTHIKRKYGDEYMKYYPYHLDPDYDDENGNPYDYGFGDDFDNDDDSDDWWRK